MRPAIHRRAVLSVLAFLTTIPILTTASPFPTQPPEVNVLINRACANPCGFYGQVCCQPSEQCYTDSNGQAACRAAAQGGAGGTWEMFTTTYTRTDFMTVTSTGSRYVVPTAPGNNQCKVNLGETACGNTCCSAAQMCNPKGVCVENGGSPWETIPGPSPSPPVRPTSGITYTTTSAPTATVPFIPAVSTNGVPLVGITHGSGGLSGGAIAGIVIGSIAGAFILLLLCLCCCIGGLASRFRSFFGGGARRRTDHHGGDSYTSASSLSISEGRYHTSGPPPPKKQSWWTKYAFIAAIIGGIALCLGLRKKPKSEKHSSYYSSESYTASSSLSSSSPSRGPPSHYPGRRPGPPGGPPGPPPGQVYHEYEEDFVEHSRHGDRYSPR